MALELTNISMPMAALLASLIGATATIAASLLNLRIAWKKELLARAHRKPVTKKSSRGPIVPLLALLLASAVGGFALSHYLASKGRAKTEALEAELESKIEQLNVATERLEQASLSGMDAFAQQVRDEERRKRGTEGAAAVVILEKCVGADVGEPTPCDKSTAQPVRLCAEIPASARVTAVDLYARAEGDERPWHDSRVAAGTDFGGGRFAEGPTEHLLSDTTKQVCQALVHWNSEHAVHGRMVVRFNPAS